MAHLTKEPELFSSKFPSAQSSNNPDGTKDLKDKNPQSNVIQRFAVEIWIYFRLFCISIWFPNQIYLLDIFLRESFPLVKNMSYFLYLDLIAQKRRKIK
ncbi:hypothetical protein MIMGU_mgv1a016984mg [Erythranthe guttata]|uniref:Uncharacterized protein n=1 Tax=Erythranthe guttata TaxID=4155 RepID=A0A022RMW1_ERYGU|nr:hypothetical protein MIMGU_mgv1a016984mg [Erythranthe guttata]